VLALGAALLVSVLYHLSLPQTASLIAKEAEPLVNGSIRGKLAIGRVESASFDGVVLRDVIVHDAAGRKVIDAKRVRARPSIWALLGGSVVVDEVEVDGAEVLLAWDDFDTDPVPSFIDAFFPKVESAPDGTFVAVKISEAHVRNVSVTGDVPGLPGLVAREVTADIEVDAKEDLLLTFRNGAGKVIQPFAAPATLSRISGRFSTVPAEGLVLRGEATTPAAGGDDQAKVDLSYPHARRAHDVGACAHGLREPGSLGNPRRRGASVGKRAQGCLPRVPRATGRPLCARAPFLAGLRCRAPQANSGTLGATRTVIDLEMTALRTKSLLPDAPDALLSGKVHLDLDESSPTGKRTVEVKLEPFESEGYSIPAIALRGQLEEGRFVLEEGTASGPHVIASATGSMAYDGDATFTVKVDADDLSRDPNLARLLPELGGRAHGKLVITRTDGRWGMELHMDLTGFRYGQVAVQSGSVRGTVALAESGAPSLALRLTARGTTVASLPLGDVNGKVRGTLSRLTVDAVASAAATGAAEARSLDVRAVVGLGDAATVVESADIAVHHGDRHWAGRVDGLSVAKAGPISLESLRLERGPERLTVTGTYGGDGSLKVHGEVTAFELGELVSALGVDASRIKGRLDAQVWIEGTRDLPQWRAEGSVDAGKVYGVPLSGAAVLALKDGQLEVNAQADFTGRGSATVAGNVTVDTTVPSPIDQVLGGIFDLDVELRGFDTQLLGEAAGPNAAPVQGDVAGSLHVGGPLFAPELSGSVLLPAITFSGWPALTIDTTFRYENSYLVARARAADAAGELLEIEGALLVDLATFLQHPGDAIQTLESLPWRVAARFPDRALETLPAPIRERIPPVLLASRVAVSATFSGGTHKPRGDVTASVRFVDASRLGACTNAGTLQTIIEATLAEDHTRATLRAFAGKSPLGTVEIDVDTPVNDWLSDVAITEVPKSRVHALLNQTPAEALPFACRSWKGPLSAELDLADLFTKELNGKLSVHSPSLQVGEVEPFRVGVDLRLTPDEIAGKADFGWWTSERAVAEVSIPLLWLKGAAVPAIDADNSVVTLDVQNAPLAPFSALLPKVDEAAGRLDGVVEARGKPGAMEMSGELRLSNGELQLSSTGQRLTDMEGLFILHSDWIEIDGLIAHDGRGMLRVDGGLQFEGWKPNSLKVAVHGTKFPIRRDGAELASITGSAAVAGEFQESADLVLNLSSLEIRMPKATDRQAQPLDSHPDVKLVGQSSDEAMEAPYVVNVLIDAANPFWVKRNDFSVQVSAELNATYADPNLFLAGFVEMKDGRFSVYGREFDIDWGAFNFDGTAGLDPSVNLSAVHRLRGGGTVTVTVSGTLTRPSVVFSSTEATNAGEIVSLLVTGRKQSRGSTPAEAERQTGDFVAGFLSGFLSITLREAFGNYVPQFAVDASGSLRAGKDLEFLIPKPLRSVVLGVYFEGQLAQQQDGSSGSGGTQSQTAASSTSQLLLELQFPYDLFFEGLWAPPDRWRLDLLWEP
jgi:autotransporter translocation and assembly factor TamB